MKTIIKYIIAVVFAIQSATICGEEHTIRFWHNGEIIYSTNIENGTTINTLPSTKELNSCKKELPYFAGWTTDSITYRNIVSNQEPTFFDFTSTITSNIDLYAVFTDGTNAWQRINTISELADSCNIIIVAYKYGVALGPHNKSNYRDTANIILSEDSISIINIGNATILKTRETNNGYTLYSEAEKHYLALTSSNTNIHTSQNLPTGNNKDQCYWKIEIGENYASITNQFYATRILRYNKNTQRFACYEQNSNVAIYKKLDPPTKWTTCFPSIEKETYYNINFYHYDSIIYTTTIKDGERIDSFPSTTNLTSNNNELKYFYGWIENKEGYEDVVSTIEPTLFDFNSPITKEINLYATFSNGNVWEIVTQTSDLAIEDNVIIAAKKSNFALSTNQKSSNRGHAAIIRTNNTITFGNDTQILTLKNGIKDNTYAFYTGKGYLYASSNTSNELKTQASLDAYGSWNINIEDTTAILKAQGNNSRNWLKYNKTSGLFSCYAYDNTTMQNIVLYRYKKANQWTICRSPQYNITLNYNDGTTIEIPSITLNIPEKYSPNMKEFIGWSAIRLEDNTNVRPTLYNHTTNAPLVENISLYPIYETNHIVLKPFDLSATHPQDIVITTNIDSTWYALKNTITQTSTQDYHAITINTAPYQHAAENNTDFIWTIKKEMDGYVIYNKNNEYLYGGENNTNIGLKEINYWSITKVKNNKFIISNANNRCLLFRSSQGAQKIGHYSVSNKNSSNYYLPNLLSIAKNEICYSSIPQKYIDIEDDTINNDIFADIIVESTSQLNVTNSAVINKLVINSVLDNTGVVNVTDGTLHAKQIIINKTINSSRWFFFSLPFDCKISNIIATDAYNNKLEYATTSTTGDFIISYYDQNRSIETGKAWEEILDTTSTLKAHQGYIIGYLGEGQITIKFPSQENISIETPESYTLDYTNTWCAEEDTNLSSKGWNLIGLPYYITPTNCSLNPYLVTVPNEDGQTYTQTEYAQANISPYTSFFVQTTTAPEFTLKDMSAAPRLYALNKEKLTIHITDTNTYSDYTTIINDANTTSEYEIGKDLTKWIGYAQIPQIYTIQESCILAYNSLSIDNSTIIPLGIYVPNNNEYTFSLSNNSNLEIELYDKESKITTNLTNKNYSINLEKGTYDNRFELRFRQNITTNSYIEDNNISIWQTNNILHINNLPTNSTIYIYDALGRLLQSTDTDNTLTYHLQAKGLYNILIKTNNYHTNIKVIY